MTVRKIVDMLIQGEDEEIPYSFITTSWGSNPTNVTVKAYDISAKEKDDVSLTVLSGSPSVTGDTIVLPILKSLTPGRYYRIEIKFTTEGIVYEAYFEVLGET